MDSLIIGGYTYDVIVSGEVQRFGVGGPPHYAGLAAQRLGDDYAVLSPVGMDFDLSMALGPSITFLDMDSRRRNLRFTNIYGGDARRQEVDGGGYVLDPVYAKRIASLVSPGFIIVSPVLGEVPPTVPASLSGVFPVAIDLQGFARRVDGGRVVEGGSLEGLRSARFSVVKASVEDVSSPPWELGIEADVYLYTSGGDVFKVVTRDGVYMVSPYRVDAPDPTGVGDYFLYVFSHYLLKLGYKPVEAAAYAAAYAASFLDPGVDVESAYRSIIGTVSKASG